MGFSQFRTCVLISHEHRLIEEGLTRWESEFQEGTRRWYLLLIALVIALLPLPAWAQTPDSQRPVRLQTRRVHI
jgi:hypothetical protein